MPSIRLDFNLADSHPDLPFPQDEELTRTELAQFDLMQPVRDRIDLDRHLPQVVLRTVPPQAVIYPREGGRRVAFYLATWEEILRLKLAQLEVAETAYERLLSSRQRDPDASGEFQQWIEHLSGVVSTLEARAWNENEREKRGELPAPAAKCALPAASAGDPRPEGLLKKFSRLWGAAKSSEPPSEPGPELECYEGELVDPRNLSSCDPAKLQIVSTAACHVLELPTELVDELRSAGESRKAVDAVYRRHVLPAQLQRLAIFSQLKSDAVTALAERAELITADPGAVICDEHEPADALYLVRNGAVQVIHNQSALLDPKELSDLPAICRALLSGDGTTNTGS